MNEELWRALELRRPEIRSRWAALLRLEKPPTPLADPDILIHLFDHTLDEVLAVKPAPRSAVPDARPQCRCDCNPMRHYFATFEQALLEALIWAQAAHPALTADERVEGVGELCRRMRTMALREIRLFDGLCQQAATTETPPA